MVLRMLPGVGRNPGLLIDRYNTSSGHDMEYTPRILATYYEVHYYQLIEITRAHENAASDSVTHANRRFRTLCIVTYCYAG